MLTVFIVDDDPNMCTCLKQLVPWNELGCNVPVVFNNPLKVLDILPECKPDFIVSDLKMPEMDGKDLCRLIREQYTDVDVIFLSAYEDFSTMQLALQYGVRGYILKPICRESINQVEKIVKKIVKEKSQERWWEQNFDAELPERLIRALAERDSDYFDCFFADMLLHKDDSLKTVQHYCLYLLHVLLDFIHKDNSLKEYTLLGANDQKGLQRLIQFQVGEACIFFVQNNYKEVLSLLPGKREKQVLIDQVHEFVAANYGDPDFGVAWIADQVHLTPAYLSRIYGRYSEVSLVEYIVAYRIRKACELLRKTFLPINQVSAQVGYPNVNYFAKLFRRQKGLSPSDYRKEYHSGISNGRKE